MKQDAEQLDHLRHSLAHLLAAAVMQLWPDTKRTIGPAIENGFYFDFEFVNPISDKDLPKIEKQMRKILPSWKSFERIVMTRNEAMDAFKGNPFKQELIEEFSTRGETLTFYKSGEYIDLCRGGHVANPAKEIDASAFKLTKVAGSYWRGDESKAALTRIYGVAFADKDALDEYIALDAEARRRDHKVLGPQLDLFTFSPLVGSGLPLWTPNGTLIRNLLDSFVWELRKAAGYMQVDIPHITKKELYEKSGHWEKFSDELFRIKTREGHLFAMKPMNCPHHTQIYNRKPWSYRELPQRYASTTKVYRDEQTGELAGLSRVRSITQDDAHVFCRSSQVEAELRTIAKIVKRFYQTFGFTLTVRVSTHDPKHPKQYLGEPEQWKSAEATLRSVAKELKFESFEAAGEAAFYGPKLDFMASDSLKRQWQVATIQLDMNMPERFDLSCTNEAGTKERIVMIHAAIMGSIERFMAILIEHTAGVFPLWLAPIQVAVLPVAKRHNKVALAYVAQLEEAGIRAYCSTENETVGYKIRSVSRMKVPYMIVMGDAEMRGTKLAVRIHGSDKIKTVAKKQFIADLTQKIEKRSRA